MIQKRMIKEVDELNDTEVDDNVEPDDSSGGPCHNDGCKKKEISKWMTDVEEVDEILWKWMS